MMTTLQIVLAIVGVLLIGAIVLYNIIQERRFRREADRMFSHRREDIMLGESVGDGVDEQDILSHGSTHLSLGRDEPVRREVVHAVEEAETELPDTRHRHVQPEVNASAFVDEANSAESGTVDFSFASTAKPVQEHAAPEPLVEEVAVPEPVAKVAPPVAASPDVASPISSAPPPPARRFEPVVPPASVVSARTDDADDTEDGEPVLPLQSRRLDSETEFVANIRFATPTATNFGPLLTTLRRIGKPVRAFSQRLDGVWEPLTSHPRSSYAQVEIGLQLADRNGAVTHDQLDAFCRALYGFAAEGGGAVSCPDKQDALQAAKALDMLCMEVDVLIGLNVMASESRLFTSEAIHKQAEEAKLVLEADGVYHARDGFGQTLFTLANQDEQPFPQDGRGLTVKGLTLLFDVPRVADGLAIFDRMTRLGFDLAWRLEGRLVDDNGRPVTEENLNRDRKRLAGFYARMDTRGIPAGGERALRLFV